MKDKIYYSIYFDYILGSKPIVLYSLLKLLNNKQKYFLKMENTESQGKKKKDDV